MAGGKEKMVLGVCLWLSEKYGLHVTLVRGLFVLVSIFGLGSPVLVYLLLYVAMPKKY